MTYKEYFSKDDYFGFTDTRILGYAEAVYDYAATATSQLSLCRGDKVAILSKTGSDKGWWKGEHCISGKVCQNYIHAFWNKNWKKKIEIEICFFLSFMITLHSCVLSFQNGYFPLAYVRELDDDWSAMKAKRRMQDLQSPLCC